MSDASASKPIVIWRITDGKPGHENQSLGLAQATESRTETRRFDIAAPSFLSNLGYWMQGRFPPASSLPSPDLIFAAGHATHLAALAARRTHGGRVVVLMRPSLPLGWFDLCLIPEHDRPSRRNNVILTRGAPNPVRPGGVHASQQGLILIGGPSRHHGWNEAGIVGQVEEIIRRQPDKHFRLTTSRRTPAMILELLKSLASPRFEIVPWDRTAPGWVAHELSEAGQVWVSEDSVSMIFEALTSGAAIGLLEVPRQNPGRVTGGIDNLIRDGLVVPFSNWLKGWPLVTPSAPLDEAGRCADLILQRWFKATPKVGKA